MGLGVERIGAAIVREQTLEVLGIVDSSLAAWSTEAIAASIRRAASFLCPTSPNDLARAVKDVLPRPPGLEDEIDVVGVVESLVSYGDLLELPVEGSGGGRRQCFLGAPGFVLLREDSALLVGVRPDGASLLSDELLAEVRHDRYARFFESHREESVAELLVSEGLSKLETGQWLRAPREVMPGEIVDFYAERLAGAGPSGEIAGAMVLDPAIISRYYKGRWRALAPRDVGTFVARRPQAFGADAWCLVDVRGGNITRLVDLPIQNHLALGADEAWRLQAAIDAVGGRPQQVYVSDDTDNPAIDFFSPLPSWLRRRLDVMGTSVPNGKGALFSYRLPSDRVAGELEYLGKMMWLSPQGTSQNRGS